MSNIKKLDWYWRSGGGAANNSYVQAWLDRLTLLGYTQPDQDRIDLLNALFDDAAVVDALTVNTDGAFKIRNLNNVLLQQASHVDFINPATHQSSELASPIYQANGFKSAGAGSGIDENIACNYSSGIELNFSLMIDVESLSTADDNVENVGALTSTGRSITMKARAFSSIGCTAFQGTLAGAATATRSGFLSLSKRLADTNPRFGKNGAYIENVNVQTAPNIANNLYTNGRNQSGSLINPATLDNTGLFWFCKGGLSDAQINAFRTAWNTFKVAIAALVIPLAIGLSTMGEAYPYYNSGNTEINYAIMLNQNM